MLRFRFGRTHRLIKPAEFQSVFDQNQVRVSTTELLLLARKNELAHPRLGLVIRKKFVRHATDRNRIKRCIREAFRLRQHEIPAFDCVVVTRPGIGELDKGQLHERLENAFDTLVRRANRQP